jgi:hypothetical protein
MKSLITHCALIGVGFVKTMALVVAGKQDKDHGWIYLHYQIDCCLCRTHFVP